MISKIKWWFIYMLANRFGINVSNFTLVRVSSTKTPGGYYDIVAHYFRRRSMAGWVIDRYSFNYRSCDAVVQSYKLRRKHLHRRFDIEALKRKRRGVII